MSTGQGQVTAESVKRLPPGIDRLPSGALRVRVYGVDGKRHTVGTYTTEREAKAAHAEARVKMLGGSYVDRKRGLVTVDAWFTEWMPDRRVRPNTLRVDSDRYRLHIKPYLGDLPLIKITPYQVSRWLGQLERDGRTLSTRKKAHTLLSTALGIHGAVGDQRLTVNPCAIARAPLPERREWTLLTAAQIEILLEHTPEWFRPCVLLGAHAGLRWSEIAGLQAKDYNRTTGMLRIERGLTYIPKRGLRVDTTKNRRTRTVPLSSRLTQTLNEHLAQHPVVGDGWLFTRDGKPLAPYTQTTLWRRVRTKAKIDCRFHDLRHSCASLLLAAGASTAEVRDMLGHQSITTTELYLHISREGLADRVTRAFG